MRVRPVLLASGMIAAVMVHRANQGLNTSESVGSANGHSFASLSWTRLKGLLMTHVSLVEFELVDGANNVGRRKLLLLRTGPSKQGGHPALAAEIVGLDTVPVAQGTEFGSLGHSPERLLQRKVPADSRPDGRALPDRHRGPPVHKERDRPVPVARMYVYDDALVDLRSLLVSSGLVEAPKVPFTAAPEELAPSPSQCGTET